MYNGFMNYMQAYHNINIQRNEGSEFRKEDIK